MSHFDLTLFDAVLLDMNGTFMFGHDRFDKAEDYYSTYRVLGGVAYDAETVNRVINTCCEDVAAKYEDAEWQNKFPSVQETLHQVMSAEGLPLIEIDLLVNVVAQHELGDVSPPYVEVLKHLASMHKLGVVSNIWSGKKLWLDLFERRGVLELFDALVFSSDGPHLKPSPELFEQAIRATRVQPRRTLFVGDDPHRDVLGAKAAGMKTLLVGDRKAAGITPDWNIPKLTELQ